MVPTAYVFVGLPDTTSYLDLCFSLGSFFSRMKAFAPSKTKCFLLFVCVKVLWPSQPNGVMSSVVSLPNHTFTGQA